MVRSRSLPWFFLTFSVKLVTVSVPLHVGPHEQQICAVPALPARWMRSGSGGSSGLPFLELCRASSAQFVLAGCLLLEDALQLLWQKVGCTGKMIADLG